MCRQWKKQARDSTLALNLGADVTRSAKQGYLWSHRKGWFPPKIKKKNSPVTQRRAIFSVQRVSIAKHSLLLLLTLGSVLRLGGLRRRGGRVYLQSCNLIIIRYSDLLVACTYISLQQQPPRPYPDSIASTSLFLSRNLAALKRFK